MKGVININKQNIVIYIHLYFYSNSQSWQG